MAEKPRPLVSSPLPDRAQAWRRRPAQAWRVLVPGRSVAEAARALRPGAGGNRLGCAALETPDDAARGSDPQPACGGAFAKNIWRPLLDQFRGGAGNTSVNVFRGPGPGRAHPDYRAAARRREPSSKGRFLVGLPPQLFPSCRDARGRPFDSRADRTSGADRLDLTAFGPGPFASSRIWIALRIGRGPAADPVVASQELSAPPWKSTKDKPGDPRRDNLLRAGMPGSAKRGAEAHRGRFERKGATRGSRRKK